MSGQTASFPLRNNWHDHRHPSWSNLDAEFAHPKKYMANLDAFLQKQSRYFPAWDHIFKAFELPLDNVKVVVVGQDPYYSVGQATGLAFAVPLHVHTPDSLQNIFHVLKCNGYATAPPRDLECWACQGVLLLNCVLTVAKGKQGSHRKNGWWTGFTKQALRLVAHRNSGAVFCLWGARADDRRSLLLGCNVNRQNVMTASHPSPRTWRSHLRCHPSFATCTHFSDVNNLLAGRIDWSCAACAIAQDPR